MKRTIYDNVNFKNNVKWQIMRENCEYEIFKN